MIRSDVVVIGGGFAGLTAALAAAKRGQTVTLLTYGEGTLSRQHSQPQSAARPSRS